MPIAYEGALKLKEISYIHAEGYPAGEMKHGPIALIDEDMPVVCLAPEGSLAREDDLPDPAGQGPRRHGHRGGDRRRRAGGRTGGPRAVGTARPWMLSPVVTVLPLQLLAYHIAALRGLDVDQPRNLAKSVTVE